ncbi:MAG: formylglycine-generating enzyme family protein [Prochlorotrichaceae cyanobacterium]|jgi:formylglycine-generating enzyme required for sulfatase activity
MRQAVDDFVAYATPFAFGETITPAVVNYNSADPYGTVPIAASRQSPIAVNALYPNRWGLFGLHGNVWEWVADQYHRSYQDKPGYLMVEGSIAWTTLTGMTAASPRVLRGGSWNHGAKAARSAARGWINSTERKSDIGFRVVLGRVNN